MNEKFKTYRYRLQVSTEYSYYRAQSRHLHSCTQSCPASSWCCRIGASAQGLPLLLARLQSWSMAPPLTRHYHAGGGNRWTHTVVAADVFRPAGRAFLSSMAILWRVIQLGLRRAEATDNENDVRRFSLQHPLETTAADRTWPRWWRRIVDYCFIII